MPALAPADQVGVAGKTSGRAAMILPPLPRLHKHADYQRVYRVGRRNSLPLMTYFFALREPTPAGAAPTKFISATSDSGPRVGLTTGRVLGKAVDRNRIKRRMRDAVRRNVHLLSGAVDVILHPRRAVLDAEFANIDREVARAFQAVQHALANPSLAKPDSPSASAKMSSARVRPDASKAKK